MIYGVINSVVKGGEDCIDMQFYDLEQAFDSLWLEDCLNDIFDSVPEENRNDKIALLHESNQVNLVAVKTAVGLTDRVNIPNIVQQGGTWGSLLCSNTVDTLGGKSRDRGEHYYLYKNVVKILPLAFVDDLNGIAKCGLDSVALNIFITTQTELKKLRFHIPDANGKTKCHKLHVGKSQNKCQHLKVHGTLMQDVKEETYLGDIISGDGKNTKNIQNRISKGVGIITQIFNLLNQVCFGPHKIETALLLRDSMLINGILTNAEVWYNLSPNEVKECEDLDRMFFRKLLGVPGSTPCEAFYLELGVLPISVVIKARRLNYLHHILTRKKEGMLYSFFITQWLQPTRGDWTEQIKQDMEDFNIPTSFEPIQAKSKEAFKRSIKIKAKRYALNKLLGKAATHSKMKNLHYNELKIQNYFLDEKVKTEEMKMIFRYRTRMERFGENFRGGKEQVICPLCQNHLDNQDLAFQCSAIKKDLKVTGNMEEIYKEKISYDTINALTKISKYREDNIEDKKE